MRHGYVYMMASKRNGTLYLGITSNLAERVTQHKEDRGSQFVKKYGVSTLVWYEEHARSLTRSSAKPASSVGRASGSSN